MFMHYLLRFALRLLLLLFSYESNIVLAYL